MKNPKKCNICNEELKEKGISKKGLCSDECEIKSAIYIDDNNCWNWTRDTHKTGYGYISEGKKKHLAHRRSYEIYVGKIPEGKIVRHKCNNAKCINPIHLEIGDQWDNIHDGIRAGNIKRKLNWQQVCNIRKSFEKGQKIADLSRNFKVSYMTIQNIVLYKKWKRNPEIINKVKYDSIY